MAAQLPRLLERRFGPISGVVLLLVVLPAAVLLLLLLGSAVVEQSWAGPTPAQPTPDAGVYTVSSVRGVDIDADPLGTVLAVRPAGDGQKDKRGQAKADPKGEVKQGKGSGGPPEIVPQPGAITEQESPQAPTADAA
eukprot:RCo005638